MRATPFQPVGAVAAAAVGLCALPGCEDDARVGTIELAEVASFGWEEPRGTGEVPGDAGVLGAVAGIAQSDDGAVHVLDPTWPKLVTFAPSGDVLDVIALSEGEGPGEVQAPIDLAMAPDGDRLVLDARLGRVVRYAPSGEAVSTLDLGQPGLRTLVKTPDTVWVSRGLAPEQEDPSVLLYSPEGESLGDGGVLTGPSGAFGAPGLLTLDAAGGVVEARNRPGLWTRFEGADGVGEGTALLPGMEPPEMVESDGIVEIRANAATAGLGVLPDGSIVVGYWTFDETEGRDTYLGILGPEGSVVAETPVEDRLARDFHISHTNGTMLAAVTDPYPRVVEYAVEY